MNLPLEKITAEKAPIAIGPYSQAIAIPPGQGLVFVSGQLPIDLKTGTLIEGSIKTLTKVILDYMEAVLIASGSSLSLVVRTDVFLVDLKDFAEMNEEYVTRFTPFAPPARQTIQVVALPKGAPLEISCIAVRKS